MPLALVVDDFRRSSSEAQAAAVHREIARQTSCSQSSLVHHRECHNRFSCSQIPVSHFSQSQTIDRTCMSNMCGAALHLDTTTLARVGHKPQPQGLECAASLARHKRNRASVNGHYVAARSLSWAVTGEPRGPLEAFLWRSLLRQFPLANILRCCALWHRWASLRCTCRIDAACNALGILGHRSSRCRSWSPNTQVMPGRGRDV